MGSEDKALDSADVNLDNDGNQTEKDLLEAGTDQSEDGKDAQETDGQEIEIVLPAEDGSQPSPKTHGIRKRIEKLNARNTAATERAEGAEGENAGLREQVKMYQLALQQQVKPEIASPPDPADFEEGAKDAKYIADFNAFTTTFVDAAFDKRAQAMPDTPKPVDARLERKQKAYFEEADKLGIKDFGTTHDAALTILGKTAVNSIIADVGNPVRVLNYLGLNEDYCQDIAELIKTNPIAGVSKLGALGATLIVQPRTVTIAPDPDLELEGTTLGKTTALDRKLNNLREKATSGDQKDLKALMEFKRTNRAAMSA